MKHWKKGEFAFAVGLVLMLVWMLVGPILFG